MKPIGLMLTVLFSIFLLAGCADRQELERQAFVVAIGLDKGEKDHLVQVTFQIANPQVNTSQIGDSQTEPPSDIVTVTASDLLSAKELVQTSLSREVTFSHLQTVIVGEELARENLFQHMIGSAIIDPEMRREAMLIVSKEEARKFIHANKPTMETRPHKYYEFMEKRWSKTGYVPLANLNAFFQRVEGELFLAAYATAERDKHVRMDEGAYLAGEVPQKSGDPVQLIGSAVLQNRKMLGTLNGEETRLSMLLRRKSLVKEMIVSFPDPVKEDYRISVRILGNGHSKIKINTKQNPAKIHAEVPIKMQIISNPGLVDYTIKDKRQNALEKSVEKKMEQSSISLIKRIQNEFKGEPFVWYAVARKNFWTMEQFEEYNWEEHFQKAKVDVKYDVTIENFGEQIRPPSIEKRQKDG